MYKQEHIQCISQSKIKHFTLSDFAPLEAAISLENMPDWDAWGVSKQSASTLSDTHINASL